MTTYAALTDGTTTVTFASPANGGLWYRIEDGWAPRVADQRASKFGGRGPYNDVSEEIPISVGGSTAAHLYANISTLKGLIEQSNRWHNGENVQAVTFRFSPQGASISSSASPLQASIWGASLDFPAGWPNIPQAGTNVWSSNLTMRLTRPGYWLHTTTTASAAGSNGRPVQVNIGASSQFYLPMAVSVDTVAVGNDPTPYGVWPAYIVCLAGSSASFATSNVESSTSPTGASQFTYVSGSAQLAYNSSKVVRYTPSGTTEQYFSPKLLTITRGRWAMFVNCRNNSASTTFTLDLQTSTVGQSLVKVIPPYSSASFPMWHMLGTMVIPIYPAAGQSLRLYVTASSAAGTLDIDRVLAVKLDENTSIVECSYPDTSSGTTYATVTSDHSTLTLPGPILYGDLGAPFRWNGNPVIVSMSGSPAFMLLGTGGSTQNFFTQEYSGSIAQNTWTVTRYSAYLTPV